MSERRTGEPTANARAVQRDAWGGASPIVVERWGVAEVAIQAEVPGNPFDHAPSGTFAFGDREIAVEGFYDGDRTYRVRFMPDAVGEWSYRITGPDAAERAGSVVCVPPTGDNHGPVRVRDSASFEHADYTLYRPYGTTCYAWLHQPEEVQERTLVALAASPFNKIRMCVFPKSYAFNEREPDRFPFHRKTDGTFDLERPDPVFFRHLEERLLQLQQLGIEADLILFHPYDKGRWGFDQMDAGSDERYLRYLLARLSAFRNVWWSLANEYDFMKAKTTADWDRSFEIVQRHDPYRHLASIHNGTRMYEPDSLALYDHHKPWVSHVSLQHWDLEQMRQWRREWGKPVVVDECGYEGDLPKRWGDLTGEAMLEAFWTGSVLGGHVGHGETFLGEQIWWSHGGDLHGESPARIAFLREVFADLPDCSAVITRQPDVPTFGVDGTAYLQYFGRHRPRYRDVALDEDREFAVEIIDTWAMTRTVLPGTHRGTVRVDLPAAPGMALLARAVRT